MNRYRVKVSDKASRKLRLIYDYIANELQMPPYAQAQVDRLEEAITKLDVLPERCKIMTAQPWHNRKVRRLLTDNYSIFYIIKEDEAIIIDILYSQSDIEKHMSIE